MNNTIRNTLGAASFFLCGALTLGALQATARVADDSVPTQKVSYADLDISKPAGAKVLYRRIVAAANRVGPRAAASNTPCRATGRSRLNTSMPTLAVEL